MERILDQRTSDGRAVIPRQRRRNAVVVTALVSIVAAMGALSLYSAPLYVLFSRATGYGGTPPVATTALARPMAARVVTVRFDANVAPNMPWKLTTPAPIQVRVGEQKTVSYTAQNLSDRPALGSATYNVTPFKAGLYFDTTRCFCSGEHVLMPGEQKQLSVTFFVDPKMATDTNAGDVDSLTFSVTYFNTSDTFFKR